MPFTQITHCVDPSVAKDNTYSVGEDTIYGLLAGLVAGGLIGLLLGLAVDPFVGIGAGIAIGACVMIREWQELYNNHRLICVAKDQCVIGTVTNIEPPPGFPHVDNDYTFNLVPFAHNLQDDRDHVVNDGFLGTQFVKDPDSILALDIHSSTPVENPPLGTNAIHCELEGNLPDVIADAICIAAAVAGALIAASSALCLALAGTLGPLGLLICIALIIAIVLLAAGAATALAFALAHDGTPADAADDANSATLTEGDVFVVKGDHVYEGGHLPDTWPEIHPVKHLQKLWDQKTIPDIFKNQMSQVNPGPYDTTTPFFAELTALVSQWCQAIKKGDDPIVIKAQKDPSNQWIDHPLIDGCQPPVIIE